MGPSSFVRRAAPVLITLVLLLGARAHADGVADEADVAFRLGAERYVAGQHREALLFFLQSHRLAPNANVAFNVARAYEQLGRFADAHRWYVDALASATSDDLRASIRGSLERLAPRVAILEVETSPPGATIYLQRRDLGSVATAPRALAVEPGEHRVIAVLPGYEPDELDVEAVVGRTASVRLSLRRIVGRVVVRADAPTSVRVDDESGPEACVAPCTLEIAPGPHVLHFTREGYRVTPRALTVRAEEELSVDATAVPLTGSLLVSATERDALVEIDGQRRGFTPVVINNVPVGTRTVRVSLQGFEPVEVEVSIEDAAQAELRDVVLSLSREVTSASRLPEPIEDAPTSISVITAQEIEAFGYPTLYEALRGQRGVALTYDGAYSSVAVRGLGQPNDYGNRLLILQNGTVLNDNVLYQSYTGFDGRADLGRIDRIELVRGAGSVLYGTGAVSGVVSIVPRENVDRTNGWVGGGVVYGDVARARGGFGLRVGDLELELEASAARGAGHRQRFTVDGDAVEIDGVDHFTAGTTTGQLHYRFLRAQWLYTIRDQRIPNGAYGTIFSDPRTRWVDQRAMGEVRAESRAGGRFQVMGRVYANFYSFDADYAYAGEMPGEDSLLTEQYRGVWIGAETRVVLRPVDTLRITVGADATLHPVVTIEGEETDASGAPVDEPYVDVSRPYQVVAGYALAEWVPTPLLRITAGARVDYWSTFGVAVNPRLALILKPTDDDVLKLFGGRAFRAHTAYEELYEDGGVTQLPSTVGGYELAPESVWSVELEYSRSFGEDVTALVSGHMQRAGNLVVTQPVDASVPDVIAYRNSNDPLFIYGADIEVRRELRGGYMLAAQYGYLYTRFKELPEGGVSRRAPFVPQHFASMRAIVPFDSLGARLALRVSVEGPRRVDTTSMTVSKTAVVADLVFSGRIRDRHLRYAIGAYNVLGYRYALPVGDTFATPVLPQLGRTFLAQIDVDVP